jgi:hypothetical protein
MDVEWSEVSNPPVCVDVPALECEFGGRREVEGPSLLCINLLQACCFTYCCKCSACFGVLLVSAVSECCFPGVFQVC